MYAIRSYYDSSMYITAERMKVIDMVPYLKSGESILSIKGAAYQPKVPEDFCGHKIGSMAGTAWLTQLQKLSVDYCQANGLQPIAISEYPTDPQTTQAMLSHAAILPQARSSYLADDRCDGIGNFDDGTVDRIRISGAYHEFDDARVTAGEVLQVLLYIRA